MPSSAVAPQRVRNRFRAKARQFDDLYEDERRLVRLLRPGLLRRRQLAVDTVRAYDGPRVLDVGCGSCRIGELVLDAGTTAYVGVDFSEPMIELARARLGRFGDRVELITEDFLAASLSGPFEVVLALGLFDYLPNAGPSAGEVPAADGTVAERFARRMFELCAPGATLVGSFPAWSPIKGPARKVRYEWIGDCPIFNYTRPGLEQMLSAAGFDRIEITAPGRSGFLVRAHRAR